MQSHWVGAGRGGGAFGLEEIHVDWMLVVPPDKDYKMLTDYLFTGKPL